MAIQNISFVDGSSKSVSSLIEYFLDIQESAKNKGAPLGLIQLQNKVTGVAVWVVPGDRDKFYKSIARGMFAPVPDEAGMLRDGKMYFSSAAMSYSMAASSKNIERSMAFSKNLTIFQFVVATVGLAAIAGITLKSQQAQDGAAIENNETASTWGSVGKVIDAGKPVIEKAIDLKEKAEKKLREILNKEIPVQANPIDMNAHMQLTDEKIQLLSANQNLAREELDHLITDVVNQNATLVDKLRKNRTEHTKILALCTVCVIVGVVLGGTAVFAALKLQ